MRTLLTICGLSLLACWPFPGDAQEESLVLYFSFDKEVADEIKDLSVHQNNGKISGKPKWGFVTQLLFFRLAMEFFTFTFWELFARI